MELTVDQALLQGVAAYKEGKLQDAERLYRAILQTQPTHPDANHNLGLIAVSVNETEAALPLFKTALVANPKIEQFWISYISALIEEKQYDNAKQALAQGKKTGLAKDKIDALNQQLESATKGQAPSQAKLNSFLEHYQNGRYDDAEKSAISITEQFPHHQFGWKALGAVLKQTGRLSEALVAGQKAMKLGPKDADAHYNLGVMLQDLGRLEEAEASYRQALALKPDYADAHNNLGVTLQGLGRLEEAEAICRQAIALKPDYADAHNNLGVTLQELGRLEEAEPSYRQAIALEPDFAEAHNNLGVTLRALGRLEEAIDSCKQAIKIKPDYAEAYYNMGEAFKEIKQFNEAVKCFNIVSTIDLEDTLGVSLQLASMGQKSMPSSTPNNYMKSFYKKKSKSWSILPGDQYRGHLLIEKAIQHTYNDLETVSILDLGCGTGSLASFLHPYAQILHGVDLSPDMLIQATKMGLYDSLYEKDIEHYLEETPHHYDMIVAAAVMVHFFDLEPVFSMIRDKLKPNGKFIFSVFEGLKEDRELNSFLMYSHSDYYITKLADSLNFKICYQNQGIHEYHKKKPINSLIYVLKNTPKVRP